MSKRKCGWEGKKEADKRRAAADFVVAETPSITSYFFGTPTGAGAGVDAGGSDSSDNDSDTTASYSDSDTNTLTLVNEVVDPVLVPHGYGNVNDTDSACYIIAL